MDIVNHVNAEDWDLVTSPYQKHYRHFNCFPLSGRKWKWTLHAPPQ